MLKWMAFSHRGVCISPAGLNPAEAARTRSCRTQKRLADGNPEILGHVLDHEAGRKVAADDALQQLASADEAERAYAAFSASLELPGARDAFADLLHREQAEEVLCSALANLSAAEATSRPLAKAARKLLRHPKGTVRADAARYLGGFVAVVDDNVDNDVTRPMLMSLTTATMTTTVST